MTGQQALTWLQQVPMGWWIVIGVAFALGGVVYLTLTGDDF